MLSLLAALLAFYFLSVGPSHHIIDQYVPFPAMATGAALICFLLCKWQDDPVLGGKA